MLKILYVRSPTVRSALASKVSGCSAYVSSVLMGPFCRGSARTAQTGPGDGRQGAGRGVGADTGVERPLRNDFVTAPAHRPRAQRAESLPCAEAEAPWVPTGRARGTPA